MATRDVVVNLSARVDSYVAAMNRARSATGALSTQSVRNMQTVGSSMQRVGRSASLYVTAPLLALGGASVGMAMDFERSFSSMEGLANVPAGEIEHLKASVLELAGQTATAPQELAEALYFAASAGLDSAQAMEVLGYAARASAAGMGSAQDVVGLLASAMASYGPEVLSAGQATDILTAAIREGRADPEELAGALGRVTPIAAAMGISFGETAGAAAYMSNILGDTDETITALRGVLLAMLDPSIQGKKALESIGTSAEELKAAIAQDGLVGAFELLRSHGLDPNSEAMSNLFEDNRALNGAMILLNDESGRLVPIIDAVTNSAGAAGTAFAVVADDKGFKMRQALVDIQTAMINLGDILLPIAASIADGVADMANFFTSLPGPVQAVITAFGGLLAVGGPLVFLAGSIVKNFGVLVTHFGSVGAAASRMGMMLGGVGLVIGVTALAVGVLGDAHLNAYPSIDAASDSLRNQVPVAFAAAIAAGEATGEIDALAVANQALSLAIAEAADEELSNAFQTLNITGADWLDTLIQIRSDSGQLASMQQVLGQATGATAHEIEGYFKLTRMGINNEQILAQSLGVTVDQYRAVAAAYFEVTGFALENQQAVEDLALAYLNGQVDAGAFAVSALKTAEGIAGSRFEAGNAIPVYLAYIDALAAMSPAQREAITGTADMTDIMASLPPELQAAVGAQDEFVGSTEEVINVQADAIDTTSDYADALEEASKAAEFMSDALNQVLEPTQNLIRAHDSFQASLLGMTEATDQNSDSLDWNTEAGLANRSAVFDLADELVALSESNIKAGVSQDETTRQYLEGREALLDAAEAAGLNRGEVEDLITAYGLTPTLITTTVELANTALSEWRIDRYIEQLDEVPEDIATQISAAIDRNDLAEAERLLANATLDRTLRVWIKVANPVVTASGGGKAMTFQAAMDAGGAFVPGGSMRLGFTGDAPGRAGDEVILPLGNPGKMATLLSMSAVGPRVVSAMGLTSAMPTSSSGGSESASVNVYVYNYGHRELTGRDVELALIRAGVGSN